MNHTKPLHEQRRRKALLALLYAGSGALVIGAIFALLSILDLVDTIQANQEVSLSTNRAVLDCTRPEGKCAREGARRTGEAVADIGRLSVYASACAADVDPRWPVRKRVADIQRCVEDLLKQPTGQPVP